MTSPRCFVCGTRGFAPTGRRLLQPSGRCRAFALACASCGLLSDEGSDAEACRADLLERLSSASFTSDETMPYGLDAYTLRIAAGLRRRGIEPAGEAQRAALRAPHAPLAAAARLLDLPPGGPPRVTLGAICRPAERDAVLEAFRVHRKWAAGIVLLLDDAPAEPEAAVPDGFAHGAVRTASRPLGGDFAAQRNALTALSHTDWMLQLDSDETLEPETGDILGPMTALAERDGLRSIGLPRRNLVGGILSEVYPDMQYRLNHRSVRYEGRVHERPIRDWRESTIALHGAIHHHLDRSHVETRSPRYEALDPGRGRLEEARRLLEPYRA